MHSAVASPCEIFTALTQPSGSVSPVVPPRNCPSSSTWVMLPSCQPDGMVFAQLGHEKGSGAIEQIHPCLSFKHLGYKRATSQTCLFLNWIHEWHSTLLLPAEFSAVCTSCCSLNCCSQPGTEIPTQVVQPRACLWDMSLSLHGLDFPLPPVLFVLLHAVLTKKAESGVAPAADFRLRTAHWQIVLSLTELFCVLLCSISYQLFLVLLLSGCYRDLSIRDNVN